MAKRKKLIISREGYILLAAIGFLIVALIVLLFATKCFGACAKDDAVAQTNEPGPTVMYDAPSAAPTDEPDETPVVLEQDPVQQATPAPSDTPAPTITLADDPNALTEPTAKMIAGAAQGVLTKSGVNMRQGPSTSTTILATGLKTGTKLTVYAEDGDFYFLMVNETKKYGYIAKKFVKLNSVLGETSDGSDQPEGTIVGIITSSVMYLREGPAVTAKSIGQYNEGKKVYIYYLEGDYYYVLVAGTQEKGYMSAQFVKADGTVPTKASITPTAEPTDTPIG